MKSPEIWKNNKKGSEQTQRKIIFWGGDETQGLINQNLHKKDKKSLSVEEWLANTRDESPGGVQGAANDPKS